MKARKLIEEGSFDPEQLKIITKAFDDAWEQIAPTISKRETAIEAARLKLATTILDLASKGIRDSGELADTALGAMSEPPAKLGAKAKQAGTEPML